MESSTMKKKPIVSVKDGLLRSIKWEHLVAGVSGGVVSTLILHPLDLVKIRFQVNEGIGITKRPQYKGLVHALTSIARSDGFIGLYQGVTPNVWGAGISWGLYFFLYSSIKSWMQDSDSKKNLGPMMHLAVAAEAGFATLVLTNPIWVTKTRLCLQYKNSTGQSPGVMYRGMADALLKIYKYEGIQGLYKGFVPGVFGISHGALQFMAYEEMKTVYNESLNQPLDSKLSSLEYITFAALSKMFAAGTTYPYQVVRSRLQDQHRKYNGVIDVVRQIWKYERAMGFYKGLIPNLLRVTPACAITFLVYEKMVTLLKQ
ncbi:mitochondrial folate transporter/carrier-like isoform X2 [Gigantopelta aegis]|uniref:mitochondrial folate transporter/carrier-like isoform X2 n=1 Tax=Gigantopelta aegis TaxID=1735272 RepID=UPI001B88C9B7|nr:mitochondrial folate transporter/carrier-like isoform X2 [Gigantopelta aegis]